jgi:hypothetical protein
MDKIGKKSVMTFLKKLAPTYNCRKPNGTDKPKGVLQQKLRQLLLFRHQYKGKMKEAEIQLFINNLYGLKHNPERQKQKEKDNEENKHLKRLKELRESIDKKIRDIEENKRKQKEKDKGREKVKVNDKAKVKRKEKEKHEQPDVNDEEEDTDAEEEEEVVKRKEVVDIDEYENKQLKKKDVDLLKEMITDGRRMDSLAKTGEKEKPNANVIANAVYGEVIDEENRLAITRNIIKNGTDTFKSYNSNQKNSLPGALLLRPPSDQRGFNMLIENLPFRRGDPKVKKQRLDQ